MEAIITFAGSIAGMAIVFLIRVAITAKHPVKR